jgi:hypothetical protein
MKFSAIIFVACLLASGAASADDSFSCGSHIVSVGDNRDTVLEHCGQPTTRDGATWTYDRGSEQFDVIVHFNADGAVSRIEERDGM